MKNAFRKLNLPEPLIQFIDSGMDFAGSALGQVEEGNGEVLHQLDDILKNILEVSESDEAVNDAIAGGMKMASIQRSQFFCRVLIQAAQQLMAPAILENDRHEIH